MFADQCNIAEDIMCLNILCKPTKCSIIVAVTRQLELSFYPVFSVLKSIYPTVSIH